MIGTGASAMQFVPAIAPDAEHVTIFQRSRHWVTPNPDYHRPVTDDEQWLFRYVPHYLSWYRVLQFWNSADRMYPAFREDPEWADQDVSISRQNDKLRRVMTAYVERELAARPDLVDEVLPDYPAFGKRMLQDNGWFRTLLRDDVDLVNERVVRVEPHAVRHRVGRDATRPTCWCSAPGSTPTSTSGRWRSPAATVACCTTSGATTRARTSASPCPGSRTCSASTDRTPTRWSGAWSSCSNARSTT